MGQLGQSEEAGPATEAKKTAPKRSGRPTRDMATRDMATRDMATRDMAIRDMAWVPGGEFLMGSNDFYPEERPVHSATVDGFWIDEHPVTVAEFRRFVKATGHVTWAERAPDPADYPGALPELLVPGSLVFTGSKGPSTSQTFRTGGRGCPAPTGGTPRVRGPH